MSRLIVRWLQQRTREGLYVKVAMATQNVEGTRKLPCHGEPEEVEVVRTVQYDDQKPGTSGLRKKVPVFTQPHYTENFVQACLFAALGPSMKGCSLAVGGDGRYYASQAIDLIIKICAANGVRKLMVGRNGYLSTPAVSHIIRKYQLDGGFILTASHNPGGPTKDFGIKFNCRNGGPAPEVITNEIFETTKKIQHYHICPNLVANVDELKTHCHNIKGHGDFIIQIIPTEDDYVEYMKEIFDFEAIKRLVGGYQPLNVLISSMNGVTGPYVRRLFCSELGVHPNSLVNIEPQEDFGGLHPDPNLTYAADLVAEMAKGQHGFGAAFDGDGDRNMILGENAFFVNPSDSLAVIADNIECIPFFQKVPVTGFARSMPTGCAVDRVAAAKGKACYEVPTGWKFFGNLMDANKIQLCGEESFGTGSVHVREKDGVWAGLAWLNILAVKRMTVPQILMEHWRKYGRNFFTRWDFENCSSEQAGKMMELLEEFIRSPDTVGKEFSNGDKTYKIKLADNFSYTDPIDGSVSSNQGIRIIFEDDSRIIFRLSGTGSTGATIRVYIEGYESDEATYTMKSQEVLRPLINIALQISQLQRFTGRDKPTVIT